MKLQNRLLLRCRFKPLPCRNDRGQSMVEFVAVLSALFLIAGLGRGYVSQLKDVIQQKYRSYCFGIAISDPPQGSYAQIGTSEDAGRTMMFSEQIFRSLPAAERIGAGNDNPENFISEQDAAMQDIKNFTQQAENL